jgi:chromosome segregation ATPase
MRNTPITDELAREFSGKRVSSREAGAVWSLCRDLERELNKVITALAQSKEANAGLMRACDKHERKLDDMTKQRDTLAEALEKAKIAEMQLENADINLEQCRLNFVGRIKKLEQERDALAEALTEIRAWGHHSTKERLRCFINKALAATEGGSHE